MYLYVDSFLLVNSRFLTCERSSNSLKYVALLKTLTFIICKNVADDLYDLLRVKKYRVVLRDFIKGSG